MFYKNTLINCTTLQILCNIYFLMFPLAKSNIFIIDIWRISMMVSVHLFTVLRLCIYLWPCIINKKYFLWHCTYQICNGWYAELTPWLPHNVSWRGFKKIWTLWKFETGVIKSYLVNNRTNPIPKQTAFLDSCKYLKIDCTKMLFDTCWFRWLH